jgi:hypothetical protein
MIDQITALGILQSLCGDHKLIGNRIRKSLGD